MAWNDEAISRMAAIVTALGGTVPDRDGRDWNSWSLALLEAIETAAGEVGGGGGSIAVTRPGTGGAGTTSSTAVMPAGSRVARVRAVVETAFNNGATARVGFSDSTSALMAVGDLTATVLSTLNAEVEFLLDVPATGTRVLRVESIGASTTGSLRVTAWHDVPEA